MNQTYGNVFCFTYLKRKINSKLATNLQFLRTYQLHFCSILYYCGGGYRSWLTSVCITVVKETEFEFWGFVFVMLAAVMSGFRWTMTQILLQVWLVSLSILHTVCMFSFFFLQFCSSFLVVCFINALTLCCLLPCYRGICSVGRAITKRT